MQIFVSIYKHEMCFDLCLKILLLVLQMVFFFTKEVDAFCVLISSIELNWKKAAPSNPQIMKPHIKDTIYVHYAF